MQIVCATKHHALLVASNAGCFVAQTICIGCAFFICPLKRHTFLQKKTVAYNAGHSTLKQSYNVYRTICGDELLPESLADRLGLFLADHTARNVIGYWHHTVVCPSVSDSAHSG